MGAQSAKSKAAKYEDYDYYPPVWNDTHRDRRRGVGWELYGLLGIKKGDREARARQGARYFKFFDAPVGLFITVDAYLDKGNWADAGMCLDYANDSAVENMFVSDREDVADSLQPLRRLTSTCSLIQRTHYCPWYL